MVFETYTLSLADQSRSIDVWNSQSWCEYRKNPKNSDTRKICDNHPKILTRWLYMSDALEWQTV